jgi:phosphoglycolate phosphatase-like HAD superfamily hydrolase
VQAIDTALVMKVLEQEVRDASDKRREDILSAVGAALEAGTTPPEQLTVPGTRELLDRLKAHGCPLYLASGTDIAYVQNEVRALRLDGFFGERVYGAIDDYQNFSKKMVIERLVGQLELEPGALVGFGDGFVEIEEVKRAGGIAVGVASDEKFRTGINDWKRNRLIQAGADIIVPDYRDHGALCECLGFAKPM